MKQTLAFATRTALAGLLVVIPIYLVVLLVVKLMQALQGLVLPIAALLPESVAAETALSVVLVVFICFLVGLAIRTRAGEAARAGIERSVFEKIPGYKLFRSLTQQVAGESHETFWKPALFETDEGLLPAFIIEEFEDGRYTIFVPSIPTPFAGAVYILDGSRVHPLDVPMTDALKVVTQWGLGAKALIAAMERQSIARGESSPPFQLKHAKPLSS
jgi:uncharacterized membrane protein